jgi:heme-degrading monooxygenase HmoA
MAKAIVQHRVADYDSWIVVFNEHEAVRRAHGATGHSISREAADPSSVVIVNEFATLAGAQAFAKDPSLPEAMAKGGVIGHPVVFLVDEAEARAY